MSCTVLSAGGTKICKADTSHWTGQAPVGLAALQEECIALSMILLKLKNTFFKHFGIIYV